MEGPTEAGGFKMCCTLGFNVEDGIRRMTKKATRFAVLYGGAGVKLRNISLELWEDAIWFLNGKYYVYMGKKFFSVKMSLYMDKNTAETIEEWEFNVVKVDCSNRDMVKVFPMELKAVEYKEKYLERLTKEEQIICHGFELPKEWYWEDEKGYVYLGRRIYEKKKLDNKVAYIPVGIDEGPGKISEEMKEKEIYLYLMKCACENGYVIEEDDVFPEAFFEYKEVIGNELLLVFWNRRWKMKEGKLLLITNNEFQKELGMKELQVPKEEKIKELRGGAREIKIGWIRLSSLDIMMPEKILKNAQFDNREMLEKLEDNYRKMQEVKKAIGERVKLRQEVVLMEVKEIWNMVLVICREAKRYLTRLFNNLKLWAKLRPDTAANNTASVRFYMNNLWKMVCEIMDGLREICRSWVAVDWQDPIPVNDMDIRIGVGDVELLGKELAQLVEAQKGGKGGEVIDVGVINVGVIMEVAWKEEERMKIWKRVVGKEAWSRKSEIVEEKRKEIYTGDGSNLCCYCNKYSDYMFVCVDCKDTVGFQVCVRCDFFDDEKYGYGKHGDGKHVFLLNNSPIWMKMDVKTDRQFIVNEIRRDMKRFVAFVKGIKEVFQENEGKENAEEGGNEGLNYSEGLGRRKELNVGQVKKEESQDVMDELLEEEVVPIKLEQVEKMIGRKVDENYWDERYKDCECCNGYRFKCHCPVKSGESCINCIKWKVMEWKQWIEVKKKEERSKENSEEGKKEYFNPFGIGKMEKEWEKKVGNEKVNYFEKNNINNPNYFKENNNSNYFKEENKINYFLDKRKKVENKENKKEVEDKNEMVVVLMERMDVL